MFLDANLWHYEIALHLEFVDLYRLKCSNRYFSNCFDLSSKLVNPIHKRLTFVFENQLDELKSILNWTDAIISGSFIPQSILNENLNTDLLARTDDNKA